jgi:hypothetical protein
MKESVFPSFFTNHDLIQFCVAAGASEFMLQDGNEEEDRLNQEQMETQFWQRVAKLQTKSRRVEKALTSPKAKDFFNREPNAREGYDTMWVSAMDNACFKSLVGNFRNYGIEFADNFGDWQDGCP